MCYCPTRELTLGTRAYVCQVCNLYSPAKNNRRFSEVYEESKKVAEKKIKDSEIKAEEFKIVDGIGDEEIDLTIDEFEEEIEEEPKKFEKRKAGKTDLADSEEITEVECPFCGELFDDLKSHIRDCEFAPDDANISDILPKSKKKRKKKVGTTGEKKEVKTTDCPYCGKSFQRLGRHLNSCKKKPADAAAKEN